MDNRNNRLDELRPPGERYDGRHTETATEARQGSLGRPVFYVLVAGLLLAAAFLIGTQLWAGTEDLPEAPAAAIEPPAGEELVTPPATP